MAEYRLVHGSGADAARLAPDLTGSCRLVVTSPPYHNAISYGSHVEDASANYRARSSLSYADAYHRMLNGVWDACHDMLSPGGLLCINVGTVLEDGYHYPLPQDILNECLRGRRDWLFLKNILWHKVTAGVRRAGSVIKHGLPGYWYPNIMTEHVIVLRKPGGKLLVNSDVPREWSLGAWDIAPVPPRTVAHPAPFPEDLPHRLIRLFTAPGDAVMDPFCGSGTTVRAAVSLSRFGVGFEVEKSYIELSEELMRLPSRVRARQLRIRAVPKSQFIPGRSRGETRYGAGIRARRRASGA